MRKPSLLKTIFNLTIIAATSCFLISCAEKKKAPEVQNLVIFHAGSLAVPFKQITEAFKAENSGVNFFIEAAGSRECARKISELKKPCDIMASADYIVIDNLLIPDHADWNIKFVANEMTIVYHEGSKRAEEINKDNWYEILLDKNVTFGRSNPDADPCGYRAVLTMKLAEKFYNKKGLAESLIAKNNEFMRPKEVDLLALLESNTIDYIFLYRSVAQQHELKYLLLPDEVNLKTPEFGELYKTVSVDVSGKTPGTTITQVGAPMVYGITVPKNAPNPDLAKKFVAFVLDKEKGLAIMEKNGQPSMVPSSSETYDKIPEELKKFAIPVSAQ
jgi:molybdate/tungstate transport system substrate-binding protein